MKKISVITVSYNAAERIVRTIKSIVRQDCRDFEYIVVDGASTDGTQEIIECYSHQITKWISEPDTGIYSAMNKGVRMASGEYCIFMNAGDMFCNSTVLSKVMPHLDGKASIVMGNQIYLDRRGRFSFYGKTWDGISRYRMYYDSLYHQASFIRKADLLSFPYDEDLRMVSDWKEALVLLLENSFTFKPIDIDIDYFFKDGVTYSQDNLRRTEAESVRKVFFPENERESFHTRMKSYKSLLNPQRYLDHLCHLFFQTYKRMTLTSPKKWE